MAANVACNNISILVVNFTVVAIRIKSQVVLVFNSKFTHNELLFGQEYMIAQEKVNITRFIVYYVRVETLCFVDLLCWCPLLMD